MNKPWNLTKALFITGATSMGSKPNLEAVLHGSSTSVPLSVRLMVQCAFASNLDYYLFTVYFHDMSYIRY